MSSNLKVESSGMFCRNVSLLSYFKALLQFVALIEILCSTCLQIKRGEHLILFLIESLKKKFYYLLIVKT